MNKEIIGLRLTISEFLKRIDLKNSKDNNLRITTSNGGGKHHVVLTNIKTGDTLLLEAHPRYETKLEEIQATLLNILDYHPSTDKEIRREVLQAEDI